MAQHGATAMRQLALAWHAVHSLSFPRACLQAELEAELAEKLASYGIPAGAQGLTDSQLAAAMAELERRRAGAGLEGYQCRVKNLLSGCSGLCQVQCNAMSNGCPARPAPLQRRGRRCRARTGSAQTTCTAPSAGMCSG